MRAYRAAAVRAARESLPMGRSWLPVRRRPGMERDPDRLPPRGLDATIGDWDAQRRPHLDRGAVAARLAEGPRRRGRRDAAVRASGREDLAWWCDRAVDAAARRL